MRIFRWSEDSHLEKELNDPSCGNTHDWTYIPAPRAVKKPDNYELQNPVHTVTPEILSKEEVRKTLMGWVRRKLRYKNELVREMEITEIMPSIIFYYVLDTFIEQRALKFSYQENPVIGTALPPNRKLKAWEVQCFPVKSFQDETKYFHMPNSDKKGMCISCYGRGLVLCATCWGSGEIDCRKAYSNGRGRMLSLCPECTGNNTADCEKCSAIGHIQCLRCSGKGKVWYFTNLKVEYLTHRKYKLIADEDFPTSAVQKAHGLVLHDHTAELLTPISTCSEEEVNIASQVLVEESHFAWPDSRIVQQQHSLKAIPVSKVLFTWEGLNGYFWIYGTKRQIYFKNYPLRKTCWP
ncbi:protein SSUH2 homolog [Carcharodon carcharias]|uniref:protein SSUH2 homolog n=1 Tax=Carcharodon carcharias TaxID=13397 RepID=UPI001B7EF26B|nr:protein SSUH2 homolog [Carcharodon carcharias]